MKYKVFALLCVAGLTNGCAVNINLNTNLFLMNANERYRVKQGLGISGKDLFRRFKSNTLEMPQSEGTSDVCLDKFSRMSKTELLHELTRGSESINSLKSKVNGGQF